MARKSKRHSRIKGTIMVLIGLTLVVLVSAGVIHIAGERVEPDSKIIEKEVETLKESYTYATESEIEDESNVADLEDEVSVEIADDVSDDVESPIREISCWGDSLTAGYGASYAIIRKADGTFFDASYLSYPEVLEQLTGITTHNFGVIGAESDEIAIMQGGWSPYIHNEHYEYIDMDIMEQSDDRLSDILVLEIGSNGGWYSDYDLLIEQYMSMIEHADCDDYIIIGDTDDPGTSWADDNQGFVNEDGSFIGDGDTYWEAALSEAFGDHFINMRAYLIDNGLEVAGLTANAEDKEMAIEGCISTQLRADWTHLNSYGYYAKAVAVYEKGVELGYWN